MSNCVLNLVKVVSFLNVSDKTLSLFCVIVKLFFFHTPVFWLIHITHLTSFTIYVDDNP